MSQKIDFRRDYSFQFGRARAFLPPKELLGHMAMKSFILEERISFLTRSVEVFLRFRFGVRGHYLGQAILLAGIAYCACWAVATLDPVFSVFCALCGTLALYHWVEAFRCEQVGKTRRFSWSHGDPLPFWEYAALGLDRCGIRIAKWVSYDRILFFGEPALCLLLGLALLLASKALGIFFIFNSVLLFLKSATIWQRMMNIERDAWDARFLSAYLIGVQKPIEGAGARQVHVVRMAWEAGPEQETPAAQVQEVPVAAPVLTVATLPASKAVETAPKSEESITTAEHLRTQCDSCGHWYKVNRQFAGWVGKCRRCGNPIAVPLDKTAAAY